MNILYLSDNFYKIISHVKNNILPKKPLLALKSDGKVIFFMNRENANHLEKF